MKKLNRIRIAVRRAFEGEDAAAAAAANQQQQAPPNNQQQQAPPNPATGAERTYSQSEYDKLVNARIAEERRKLQSANQATVKQLEQLQQNQALTQQERDALQTQINELSATFKTAEETKKIELDKLTEKHNTQIKKTTDERDSWKNRFETNLIKVDITNAAVKYNAVSPEQIEAYLTPRSRCAEVLDDNGKPTGRYASKVKFEDIDKDEKPIVLDLDTDAAVKLMRERPNRFGNLFRNVTNGGTGSLVNAGPSITGELDINKMSPQEYFKNRATIHKQIRG